MPSLLHSEDFEAATYFSFDLHLESGLRSAWVTQQTLHKARLVREELCARWEALLAAHRCDAHIYLEVGSPIPQRKGLEDTPMPGARRTGVTATDLGWPVLSLPVSTATGLEIPVSAQLMARRWHDHRLLAWGMVWQQRHPEFVGKVFPQPTPA